MGPANCGATSTTYALEKVENRLCQVVDGRIGGFVLKDNDMARMRVWLLSQDAEWHDSPPHHASRRILVGAHRPAPAASAMAPADWMGTTDYMQSARQSHPTSMHVLYAVSKRRDPAKRHGSTEDPRPGRDKQREHV